MQKNPTTTAAHLPHESLPTHTPTRSRKRHCRRRTGAGMALLLIVCATLVMTACNGSNSQTKGKAEHVQPNGQAFELKGDSTLYGLACEGSNDTVLVFLPDDGSDPVSYDILQARMEHRVKGRIKTGDNLALLLSNDSLQQVVSLIDLDVLKGAWAYQVMPQLKERLKNMPQPANGLSQARRDSMLKRFMVPREYGMRLLRDNTVERIGGRNRQQQNENSPVEYPRQPRYTEWHLWNGKLILTAGNIDIPEINERYKREVTNDTAEIVLLRKDSLQLRFGEELRCYYRKKQTD